MKLNLNKALCVFDIESTGVNVASDRIVEISILKVMPDGTEESKTWRAKPGIPIPDKISALIGIKNEDVENEPEFKQIAAQIASFIGQSDIAGYNSIKFDIPLLAEEFLRAEIEFDFENRKLIDVQNIFHFMEPRTLSAAYKFYCEKNLENAHTAEADTRATFEVLKKQIERYENVELDDDKGKKYHPVLNDMTQLHKLSNRNRNVDFAGRIVYNENGVEVFNFGKHKDKPVHEVFQKEPSYYTWIMNGDFPLYTKRVVTQIRLRSFNQKKN